MNLFKKLAVSVAIAASVGAASAATAFGDGGAALQGVINSLYTAAGTPIAAAPNVNNDQYGLDELWQIEASGVSAATIIIEVAGNANNNALGIYDSNDASKRVTLFGGLAGAPDRATLQILNNGQVVVTYYDRDANGNLLNIGSTFTVAGFFSGQTFGYFLDTGNLSGVLFSESARNANGQDQMVAYQGDGDTVKLPGGAAAPWGSSSFIMAWEDIAGPRGDYDDFVVYVESVQGVPEPGTLGLLGLSLAGLGLVARRRRAN